MRKLLPLIFLIIAGLCFAQQPCEQTVPKLMEVDGINDTLANIGEMAKQSSTAELDKQPDLSAADRQAILNATTKGVDQQRLQSNVRQVLVKNCDAAAFATVLHQLQSPLGQKMRTMEAYSSTPKGSEEMRTYLTSLQEHQPKPSRVQLLQEFVTVTRGADTFTDMVVAVSTAMTSGVRGKEPLPEEIAQIRAQVSANAANQMLAFSLFTYRDATDEEMTQYLAMYKTAPFQTFNDATSKALVQGVSGEMHHVGEELKKVIDQKRASEGLGKS